MKYLSIKNWSRYQHYSKRHPPWVKLHVSILDDYEFFCLQDASKAHLLLLFVLASKYQNRIPYDLALISQKIGATSAVDIEELVLQGFMEVSQDDGKMLAPRKQNGGTETETYTEEGEKRQRQKRPSAVAEPLKGLALCSKSDCDAQFTKWGELFGAMEYATFRKKLLTTYQPGQPLFTLPERLDAMAAAREWWIEQDDKDQGFFGFDKFLAQLGGKWIPCGRMEYSERGELTERGSWAGSKAMRESARRPRLA